MWRVAELRAFSIESRNMLNTSTVACSPAERIRRRFGHFLHAAELAGLIVIGLATAFAMAQEAWKVMLAGEVSLTDLLLMFLYLEVLAMDVRYLRLGRLPVRFPLFIAMTSLARDLILRGATDSPERMLMTTFGIVLLALGVLILSFGQHRYPAEVGDVEDDVRASR
ncbi:protein PsiE [Burkholderia multivorans CF2]|nr:protein PsiE [Burkholderia multivorans CF2]